MDKVGYCIILLHDPNIAGYAWNFRVARASLLCKSVRSRAEAFDHLLLTNEQYWHNAHPIFRLDDC